MKALFLDRDGVLNVLRHNDYVKTPGELEILPGVVEAMRLCREHFGRIFIVTNQQGIGKGLMTEADLEAIHRKLVETIGPVDRIYHCPALERDHSFRRKPNIGMALQARHDFPDIRLKESVKGAPFKQWFYFLKKNFGIFTAVIHAFTPYIRIILKK